MMAIAAAALMMASPIALASPEPPHHPCELALQDARASIADQLPELSVAEAIELIQAQAGEACFLDLRAGATYMDPETFLAIVNRVSDKVVESPPAQFTTNLREVVPCSLPGAGGGIIEASALGIPLQKWTAAGDWAPTVQGFVKVTGSAGIIGGAQSGPAGLIMLGPAAIPALGNSSATCVETTVTTQVVECFMVPLFWLQCTQTISTDTNIVACGAKAHQTLLSLVNVDHTYRTDVPGC